MATLRLAQSVEHETLNLRVVGSSPTLGDLLFHEAVFMSFLSFELHLEVLVNVHSFVCMTIEGAQQHLHCFLGTYVILVQIVVFLKLLLKLF